MANSQTQVCIIGMGAVGGTMAHALTEAGLEVIGLEAGPTRGNLDFPMDELRAGFVGRNEMGGKYIDELPTWRLNASSPTRAALGGTMMNGVGGSTVHWCAATWRFHKDDFSERTSTIRRYGEGMLPPDADLQDWPVSYRELEPFYEKMETVLGVAGKAGNIRGRKIPGGNPFEAPRSGEFPLPPLRENPFGEAMREVATRMGYNPFPAPSAINSQPYEGRPACTYCGFCCGFGCHVGAKASTLITSVPKAIATGRLDMRTHARVTRINIDGQGRASGVEYFDLSGERHTVEAPIIILASYCLENNRLLMLSTDDRFPNGLANHNGLLGKYYMTHQTAGAVFFTLDRDINRWAGPVAQSMSIDDFNADNFDHTGLGFLRGGRISAGNQHTPIAGSSAVPPGMARWGSAYKQFIHENWRRTANLTTGGGVEMMPYEANYLDLDPVRRDRYGQPVIRITLDFYDYEKRMLAYLQDRMVEIAQEMGAVHLWRTPIAPVAISLHDYGGARMGNDPAASVVNRYGEAHSVPGLFVLGGSQFPTSPSWNPTGTIIALAYWSADHISREWSRGRGM